MSEQMAGANNQRGMISDLTGTLARTNRLKPRLQTEENLLRLRRDRRLEPGTHLANSPTPCGACCRSQVRRNHLTTNSLGPCRPFGVRVHLTSVPMPQRREKIFAKRTQIVMVESSRSSPTNGFANSLYVVASEILRDSCLCTRPDHRGEGFCKTNPNPDRRGSQSPTTADRVGIKPIQTYSKLFKPKKVVMPKGRPGLVPHHPSPVTGLFPVPQNSAAQNADE